MNKVYPSKIDAWLGLIIGGLPVAMALVLWKLVQHPASGGWIVAGVMIAVGVLLPVSILGATRYTITEQALAIRCGFFRWQIPLQDITSLEATRDPLSSPALSLDRLCIGYGAGKTIMISPADQEGFLRDLRAKLPQLSA